METKIDARAKALGKDEKGEFFLLPFPGADLHLFQTKFVIGWENNRDGDIIMPLSLKTIGNAGYRDQWNKRFGCMQVKRFPDALRTH